MDSYRRITPEEFDRAKASFDPQWGAPKAVRRALGTYDNPDQWWSNFNKFYPEDKVVDLSGVPGFAEGDYGIPIPAEDRTSQDDPYWTVFNPAGLDFGDVNQHGDIVANILGYVGARAGMAGAGFAYGGPAGTIKNLMIGEPVANVAAQGAEAAWDAYARSSGESYLGDQLEGPGAGEIMGDRATAGAIDTAVGGATELLPKGIKAVGEGAKRLWQKVVPPKETDEVIDHSDRPWWQRNRLFDSQHTRDTRARRYELENPGRTNVRNPITGEWGKVEDRDKYQETWFDMVQRASGDNREATIREIDATFGLNDPAKAAEYLDELTRLAKVRVAGGKDAAAANEEGMKMAAMLNMAEQNLFPIKVSGGSLGTVTDNRLIQMMEDFSNLFPFGHEVFRDSYHKMIRDIEDGVQDVARSWLKGKAYKGQEIRPGGPTNQYYADRQSDLQQVHLSPLAGDGETLMYPYRMEPAEMRDRWRQYIADIEANPDNKGFDHAGFEKWFGGKEEFVPPIYGSHSPSELLDEGGIQKGSAVASHEAMGSYARQGAEAGHKKRERQYGMTMEFINDLYFNQPQRTPPGLFHDGSMDFGPNIKYNVMPNTEKAYTWIAEKKHRVMPSGADIWNLSHDAAFEAIVGLQPKYNIARKAMDDMDKMLSVERQALMDDAAKAGGKPATGDETARFRYWADILGEADPGRGELVEDLSYAATVNANLREMLNANDEAVKKGVNKPWSPEDVAFELRKLQTAADDLAGRTIDPRAPERISDTVTNFYESNPTVMDMVREYYRLGEVLNTGNLSKIDKEPLEEVRNALRSDIEETYRRQAAVDGESGEFGGELLSENWRRLNDDREEYLQSTYYPMLKDIIEAKDDLTAYELLTKHTQEGPAQLQKMLDEMPYQHQDAIKAMTFLRLGKKDPHSYAFEPDDIDITKISEEWNQIPSATKDVMWEPKGHPLRDAMDTFMEQVDGLGKITDRAGEGQVGRIVAATIVVGGAIGAVTNTTLTGDFGANAAVGGFTGGALATLASTLTYSYASAKLFTNERLLDSLTRIVKDAEGRGKMGQLKDFFSGAGKGTLKYGLNRFMALSIDEGMADTGREVVAAIERSMTATAATMDSMYGELPQEQETDWQNPEDVQAVLERLDEGQALELRTGMSPERIKTLEDIYSEAMGAP